MQGLPYMHMLYTLDVPVLHYMHRLIQRLHGYPTCIGDRSDFPYRFETPLPQILWSILLRLPIPSIGFLYTNTFCLIFEGWQIDALEKELVVAKAEAAQVILPPPPVILPLPVLNHAPHPSLVPPTPRAGTFQESA